MRSIHPMRKTLKYIFGLGLLLSTFLLGFQTDVFAQGGRYEGWHPMMRGWGMGGFGMILNMAIWILAIVAIVWLVRWLFRLGGRTGNGANAGSRALDILNERYASGEIDKTKFEAMKRDISSP